MSGFQRMVAMPQEEYFQLKSLQNVQQPLTQYMTRLEQDYQEAPLKANNPYEQMVMRGSALDDIKLTKEKLRNDLSLGTPKPYRNRALSLYRSLEPVVKFNERGEMFDETDKVIPDSRAEDLIQHAIRDRRRNFTPVAWNEFLNVLKKHNIPKSILNRDTIDEIQKGTLTKRKLAIPKRTLVRKRTLEPSKLIIGKKRKIKPSSRYPDTQFLKDF